MTDHNVAEMLARQRGGLKSDALDRTMIDDQRVAPPSTFTYVVPNFSNLLCPDSRPLVQSVLSLIFYLLMRHWHSSFIPGQPVHMRVAQVFVNRHPNAQFVLNVTSE